MTRGHLVEHGEAPLLELPDGDGSGAHRHGPWTYRDLIPAQPRRSLRPVRPVLMLLLRRPMDSRTSALREVALVFLKLGCTAFGGPAAHVALQEEECVRRRHWLDRQRFLDLLAATNLVPGPNSTEMAIHLGRLRAGWPGLVVGGVAFAFPSAALVTALAWAYSRWGAVPEATALLAALRPAVLIVILDALSGFARAAVRGPFTVATALAAGALALGGVSEVALVFAGLGVGVAAARVAPGRLRAVPLLELFLVCTKIGATLFGSGYVLIAYLRSEFVGRGWLDDGRLLDAVAVGQITPGPVSTAATFVGYLIAGAPGAAVATVGMFLPSFVFVALTGPLVERWRGHPVARGALDVVNAAVVGLIAAVVVRLAPAALTSPFAIAVGAAAAVARWGLGLGGTMVMAAAALAGLLRAVLGATP
jgi:chromate transporter